MSLGKDLASIRKSQNLTLEDIQNAVKIPLDTLKSIEDGSIFSDPTKNKTYVRSFVRSYAKVLKIDDKDVVRALDEMEAGTYSGNLFRGSREETPETDFVGDTGSTTESDAEAKLEKQVPESKYVPKVQPQIPPDDINSVNWADMGRKFSTASKSSKVWLFILLFVILGSLAGAAYFFWEDITSFLELMPASSEQMPAQPDQNAVPPTPLDTSDVIGNQQSENVTQPEVQEEETSQSEPIELDDTLTLVVYAAYGQLEPIRVTSDLNWRTNPFWMEQGEAYNFDFRDTLLVRGQYSRLLLLFNGHIIENPRQNYFNTSFNSIMITRSVLDQPQYLAQAPRQFPLEVGPPDSIVYRIRF